MRTSLPLAGLLALAFDASDAVAETSPLSELGAVLTELGTHRVARMDEPATDAHPAWALTAATQSGSTWVCLEADGAEARCFTIDAEARGYVMPGNPAHTFPLVLSVSLELGPGNMVDLLVQFPNATDEPTIAVENLFGASRPRALPSVRRLDDVPGVLPRLAGLELSHASGELTYAAHRGAIAACEMSGDRAVCTEPVRVANEDERLEIDPDSQGPELYELEVHRERTVDGSHVELEHVMVFRRSTEHPVLHVGTVPFGGLRETPAAGDGAVEQLELLFEDLEVAGAGCIFIGRPEPGHRARQGNGTERRLPRPSTTRLTTALPELPMGPDAILLDSSGYWELDATRQLRRVRACSRPTR